MNDPVTKPAHYTSGKIECIAAIEAASTPEEFQGWLKGNIIKYVWRWRNKGGHQDLGKALFYLERLHKMVGETPVENTDEYKAMIEDYAKAKRAVLPYNPAFAFPFGTYPDTTGWPPSTGQARQ